MNIYAGADNCRFASLKPKKGGNQNHVTNTKMLLIDTPKYGLVQTDTQIKAKFSLCIGQTLLFHLILFIKWIFSALKSVFFIWEWICCGAGCCFRSIACPRNLNFGSSEQLEESSWKVILCLFRCQLTRLDFHCLIFLYLLKCSTFL